MTTEDKAGFQAIVDAGAASAHIVSRSESLSNEDFEIDIPVVLVEKGQRLEVPEKALEMYEERLPGPRHREGISLHHTVASFIAHVKRQGDSNVTTIWAYDPTTTVIAIYDYHGEATNGWLKYKAKYTAPVSPEWEAWQSKNGQDLSQDEFAEWLEERRDDITSRGESEDGEKYPQLMELLEMVKNLNVYTKGTFERRVDATTGASHLVCKTDVEKHSTKIWPRFKLALRVFEGDIAWSVEVRVFFRLAGGRPTFRYELYRHAEIKRRAFESIVNQIDRDLDEYPLFRGVPER